MGFTKQLNRGERSVGTLQTIFMLVDPSAESVE